MAKAGTNVDVAIIGAGPAGLTAGYLLTKAGYSVAMIERDPRHVGGIGRAVDHGGRCLDIGGQRIAPRSHGVAALWEEILPGGIVARPPARRILHDGQFHRYPPSAVDACRRLGVVRAVLCLASLAKARLLPRREARSFEDRAIDAWGRTLYATFLKGHAEKLWGMPCDRIAADWGAQHLRQWSVRGAVAAALRRVARIAGTGPGQGAAAAGGRPEDGRNPAASPGRLWDAARDHIVTRGGRILMGHSLHQLRLDEAAGRWTVTAHGADGLVSLTAGHVVSSAPLRELASRLHPLPASLPEASSLRYRDLVTVALTICGRDPVAGERIHVLDPRVKVGRIHTVRPWAPDEEGGPAQACVGLEYFCFEGDGLWTADDPQLVALATAELATLGLCRPSQVTGGVVVRQDKAYPVQDLGCAQNVDMLRREIEGRYPTLHSVGRAGMHRDDTQDQATAAAMMTVRNIQARARVCDAWAPGGDARGIVRGETAVPRDAGATAAASKAA